MPAVISVEDFLQMGAATYFPRALNPPPGAPSEQHVFFVGQNGQLIDSWWDSISGHSWQSQSLPVQSPPASDPIAAYLTIYDQSGNALRRELHVFFRGSDGTLQHTWYDSLNWLSETVTAAPPVAPPALDPFGNNSGRALGGSNHPSVDWPSPPQQHVFYPGTDGSLQHYWYGAAGWTLEQPPPRPPGSVASPVTAVSAYLVDVAAENSITLNAFYTAPNGQLWRTSYNYRTGVFESSAILGSPLGPPSVGQNSNAFGDSYGEVNIWFRGADPQDPANHLRLWVSEYSGLAGQISDAQTFIGPLGSDPLADSGDVISAAPGYEMHVFYIGDDLRSLWHSYWDGSAHLEQLPGTPVRLLGILDYGDGQTPEARHIYFLATDGTLQQTWGDSGSWQNETLPAVSPPTTWVPPGGGGGCNMVASRVHKLLARRSASRRG